jgi:hypothetical protein
VHASKGIFYVGIIAYSVLILLFWDWPAMTATTGSLSAVWLAKMGIDVLFAMGGAIGLAGPALFASDDEGEDEIVLHKEDLPISDSLLFGAFLINILANGGWHAYQSVMTTDLTSFYYSIWTLAEFVLLILCWVLLSHTRKVQRRRALKARQEARGPQAVRRDAA